MRLRSSLAFLTLAAACDCGGAEPLITAQPILTVSPSDIDFGEVTVGDLRVRGLTVENTGTLPLRITTSTLTFLSGEVTLSGMPTQLAPQQKVEVILTYAPVNLGEDKGTLTVDSDDGKGPKTINLRGVGVLGDVGITHDGELCGAASDSLSFGATGAGQPVTRTITVRSTGTAPFRILSAVREPGTTSEFTIMEANDVTVAPGATVTLSASYSPVDGGADSGAFIITTDLAERSSIRIPVCGEGVAPALCATPTVLDFGAVAQGTRATRTVKLESCGRLPVDLTTVTLTTDTAHPTSAAFTLDMGPAGLPRMLQPGDSVDAVVAFAPAGLTTETGFLRADSNATGVPELFIPLRGNGAEPCSIALLPATLSFVGIAQGMSSTRNVLVTNQGASSCTLSSARITAGAPEFSTTPPALPVMLGPGDVLTVPVTYAPSATMGPHMGTLTIDSGGTMHTVPLDGTTELPEGCRLDAMPTALNFGSAPLGSIRSLAVTVTNISDDPCFIRGVSLAAGSDPSFSDTASNVGLVIPGRSRQITISFLPQHQGPSRGTLNITSTDVANPMLSIPLFGTTASSGICVTPRRMPFGPATGLETMDLTITACGGTSVDVTGLDWTTPDAEFAIQMMPTLPFTLPAGAQRRVTIGYRPTDSGGDTAILTVRSNDPVDPAIPVEMTGGLELVPPTAGRFMYYWAIPNPIGGDIMRLPLQGNTTASSFWGPGSGKSCSGCHYMSPDGRYVALIEAFNSVSFKIVDTQQNVALALPADLNRQGVSYISWRPDVNAQPPYQFAFDGPSEADSSRTSIHIGSVFGGYIGEVAGTAFPTASSKMPTWGSTGNIAFIRGTMATMTQGGAGGFQGPTDLLVVPQAGGTASPVLGAAGNGFANYYPAYSPDGRWIAFTQSRSAMSTIAAADARILLADTVASGMPLTLNNANSTQGASSYPTWSVDGRFLSFSSNRPGGAGDWDIYLTPIDPMSGADGAAQNLRQANTSGFEHSAQWSP